jgi:hypothetical protein
MKQLLVNAAAMAMANIGYGIPPGMYSRDGFRAAPKKRSNGRRKAKKRHMTTVSAYFKENAAEAWKRAKAAGDKDAMRRVRVKAYGSRW